MAGRGIVIQITGDGESARRALELVQHQMHETSEAAKHEASQMSEAFERVKGAFESIGIYMGVREAIDQFKELVGGSIELGMEIGHLSQQTGISAEHLSNLKFASDETGVAFDALQKGFKKLSVEYVSANEGSVQSRKHFEDLGLTMAQVRGHGDDMYGLLALVADKFKAMPEGMEKTNAAAGLFGQRMGPLLIPFLNQGSAGIEDLSEKCRELGVQLDENGVKKMEELHGKVTELTAAWHGLGLELTEFFGPALKGAMEGAVAGLQAFHTVEGTLGVLTGNPALMADAQLRKQGAAKAQEKDSASKVADPKELAENAMDKAQTELLRARLAFAQKASASTLAEMKKASAAEAAALDAEYKAGVLNETQYLEKKLQAVQEGNKKIHAARIEHSDNSFGEAVAGLADESAKAAADAQKANFQTMLADVEAQHKMLLMLDQTYYDKKLSYQLGELDAEKEQLEAKQKDMETLQAKQLGDPTLRRDKTTNQSTEELRTQRAMIENADKLNELAAKRAQITSASAADSSAAKQAAALANLRVMAELEKERGDGIAAQAVYLKQVNELEAQKVTREGGSAEAAAAVRAQGELAEKKLQIEQVSQRIADVERDYARQIEMINLREQNGQISKKQAAEQINALHAQEIQQLQQTVNLYSTLAGELGGEYKEKALDLQAELDKLGTPDRKDEAKFAKSVADAVSNMATTTAEKTAEAGQSFHKMVMSFEKDAEHLVLKTAEKAFLQPALEGAFEGFGHSGSKAGKSGLAAAPLLPAAPALWTPPAQAGGALGKASGGVLAGLLSKLTGGGAGGGKDGPGVTIVIQNNSSQPVSAQEGASTFDGTSWVKNIILTDLAQGDVLSTAFKGMLASG